MLKLRPALAASAALTAASAALIIVTSAPALAQVSLTLRSVQVADIGRETDALSQGVRTQAHIVRAVPPEMPSFENSANIDGTAKIIIDLDARGKLTNAEVLASSGRPRLDQSALRAVRASQYQAATVNGQSVGGRYVVDVVLTPTL